MAKLMRRVEILPKAIRRFRVTTDSRKTKASPNLINRDFTSEHPNDLWLSDITYIPTREGWLYLAAVLDAYSRALVGWAMSRTLDTKLAMDALNMAIAHPGSTGNAALRPGVNVRHRKLSGNRQPQWHQAEHESQG